MKDKNSVDSVVDGRFKEIEDMYRRLNKQWNEKREKEEYRLEDIIPFIGALIHGAREWRKDGLGYQGDEFSTKGLLSDILKFKNPKRSLFLGYHLISTSLLAFAPVIYDYLK